MEINYANQTALGAKTLQDEAGRVRVEQSLLEQLTHGLNDRLSELRGQLGPVLLPPAPETPTQVGTNPPEPNRSSVAQQTHFIAGLISDMCANVDDLLRRLDV